METLLLIVTVFCYAAAWSLNSRRKQPWDSSMWAAFWMAPLTVYVSILHGLVEIAQAPWDKRIESWRQDEADEKAKEKGTK